MSDHQASGTKQALPAIGSEGLDPSLYYPLCLVYDALSKTTRRLEKTSILSIYLKALIDDTKSHGSIAQIILLLQGKVFTASSEDKLGVSSKTVIKALARTVGVTDTVIERRWKELGDLGDVAYELASRKRQATLFSEDLTIAKVFSNLKKLAAAQGKGAINQKIGLISELLGSAKPLESRFIIRTVLEDLRIGVAEGTFRDALVWAFFSDQLDISYDLDSQQLTLSDRDTYNAYTDQLQQAYDLTNDFAKLFELMLEYGREGLAKISLTVGTPIKVMLAQKAIDINDALKRVGSPAAFEYKYDGFRIQAHRIGQTIRLFTRRLEEVTGQFPDLVEALRDHVAADGYILDCEAVGYDQKTGKNLPFQKISQRIKRKYDIDKMVRDYPVMLNVFDIIALDEKSMISLPFTDRRAHIEKIILPVKNKVRISELIKTDDPGKVKRFFDAAIDAGNEGLMAKKLSAPYKPGSRVGFMVKVKETMENLELVIVSAEWGEGKRFSWLSSFTLACIDDDGNFLEIGKVGTGIKEKEASGISFEQLTNLLKPDILSESGRSVKLRPNIIVEVAYEEIQKSPTYASGYALRFPRLLFLREDRRAADATPLSYIEDLYYSQNK